MRVEARHPELAIDSIKDKLRAEGLDEKAIHKKLYKENIKYKLTADIIMENRDMAEKYMLSPDGPELLEKEMVKRLEALEGKDEVVDVKAAKIAKLERQLTELQEELEVEKSREENLDVGITSKRGASMSGKKPLNPKSADLNKVLSMLGKKGMKMTQEEYDDMLARRQNIRGANTYGDDEERG